MTKEITTSGNVPTGNKIEITPEVKAEIKARDSAQLELIKVEKDEIIIQLEHARRALELNLPNRKVEAEIKKLEFELAGITKNGKILEERGNKK